MKSNVSSLLPGLILWLCLPMAIYSQSDTHIIANDSIKQGVRAGFPNYGQSAAIGEPTTITDQEERFNEGNNFDPWQLIQGRLAGVSITRPGGCLLYTSPSPRD